MEDEKRREFKIVYASLPPDAFPVELTDFTILKNGVIFLTNHQERAVGFVGAIWRSQKKIALVAHIWIDVPIALKFYKALRLKKLRRANLTIVPQENIVLHLAARFEEELAI